MFWILGSVFEFWDMFSCGFWEVFWILESIFEFTKVLWILGCVLDSGTCFGFCGVFWIKFSEVFLDSGKCFWILGSVFRIWDVFCPYEPP